MNECSFVLHEIKGYISSVFLVEEKGKFLLLDTGCACDFKKIKSFLKERGKSIDDIKVVLVTHMHPDHAGGVKYFKRIGIPVASTEGAYRWYRGVGGFIQHKIDTFLAQFSARRKNTVLERVNYKRKFKPDYILKDGDVLPFFPNWCIVKTPGHTLYDISVYNDKCKIIYLADLFLRIEKKFVLPFPVLFPDLMKKSLERVSNIKLKKILLAHGGVVDIRETGKTQRELFLSLSKSIGQKIRPEFKLFYPFCLFVHDKWMYKPRKYK